jgi:hypothetical protein
VRRCVARVVSSLEIGPYDEHENGKGTHQTYPI